MGVECGVCGSLKPPFVCEDCVGRSLSVKWTELGHECIVRDTAATQTLSRIRRHVDGLALRPEVARMRANVSGLRSAVEALQLLKDKERKELTLLKASLVARESALETERIRLVAARAKAGHERTSFAADIAEKRRRLVALQHEVMNMRRVKTNDLLSVFPVNPSSETHCRILTIVLPNHGGYSAVPPEHLSAAMCHTAQVVSHLSRILDVWIPQDYSYIEFCGVDGDGGSFMTRPLARMSESISKLNAAIASLCASQGQAVRGSAAVSQTLKNLVACTRSPLLGRDGPFATYLKEMLPSNGSRKGTLCEAPIEELVDSDEEGLDEWETVDSADATDPLEHPSGSASAAAVAMAINSAMAGSIS